MKQFKLVLFTLVLSFAFGCLFANIASEIICQRQDWAKIYNLFDFDKANDRFLFKSAASWCGVMLPIACCWVLSRSKPEHTGIIDDILIQQQTK